MTAHLLDPARQAAQALRDMADVRDPCLKLRAATAEALYKVPVTHPLRVPVDQVYGWAERIQRCRPAPATPEELREWAGKLEGDT